MALFVELIVDQSKFAGKAERETTAGTCPVDAFKVSDEALLVDPENEDECIFCDRCVQSAPSGAIVVRKTYQDYMAKK